MVLDVWPAKCRQLSEDTPVCVYFTSIFTTFGVRTLWITNNRAIREWICVTWDEWVGELCVGMCVLILSCLRCDSLTGGVWTQGVGWFKCLKTTSGPPVLVSHSSAAASLNKEKSSKEGQQVFDFRHFCFPNLHGGSYIKIKTHLLFMWGITVIYEEKMVPTSHGARSLEYHKEAGYDFVTDMLLFFFFFFWSIRREGKSNTPHV